MHITLLTYGTRGDLQPFLALAIGLQKNGHRVRLAAPGRFADTVNKHGIQFAGLAGDPEVISVRFNDAGIDPVKVARSIRDYVYSIAPEVARDARKALTDADLVIHSFLFTTGGHTFAREMNIPDISVQTFPMFAPTRAFPNVAMPNVPPGGLSKFTHQLATWIFWYGGNAGIPGLSRQHPQDFPAKLSWPFKRSGMRPVTPLVFAYSPTVLPKPQDWTAEHISIPGYFFLDDPEDELPAGLLEFLAQGEPPVCVSFGSMVNQDVENIYRVVLEAITKTGQRGILLTGWGGWKPTQPREDIFVLDAAPHGLLFPRCRVLIHHGGAGTTGAGLRAGIPSLVIPFAGDQTFWGRRVELLGAGPKPIPLKKLTSSALVDALTQALHDPALRQGAAQVGEKIRGEDGLGETIRMAETWAERFPRE